MGARQGGLLGKPGLGGCRRESRRINRPDRFNRIEILIDFLLPMPYVGVGVEMEAVRASARTSSIPSFALISRRVH
jgi:hypothetical protein